MAIKTRKQAPVTKPAPVEPTPAPEPVAEKPKHKRTLNVLHQFDDGVLVKISNGTTAVYRIARVECDAGEDAGTWLVGKFGSGMGYAEEYAVTLTLDENADLPVERCTCPGHTFYKRCKHVDAVKTLRNRNELE